MAFNFLPPEAINQSNHSNNFISPDIEIQGAISSQTDLYIDNTVLGDVRCAATIYLAPQGRIRGSVQALNAVIWGKIEGDLTAANIAAIGDSAQISGKVTAHKFVLCPNPQMPHPLHLA